MIVGERKRSTDDLVDLGIPAQGGQLQDFAGFAGKVLTRHQCRAWPSLVLLAAHCKVGTGMRIGTSRY